MANESGSRATTLRLVRVSSQIRELYRWTRKSSRRRHCGRPTYELPLLLRLRLVDDVLVAVQIVAAHGLASLSSPLAVLGCQVCTLERVATADLIKALGVFPCIKINQTAQPVRDGPPPTSVIPGRLVVSTTRAAIFKRRRRSVANSAVAIPGLWEWRRARSASANKRPYGARDGPGWLAPNGNWCDRRRAVSYAA